MKIRITVELGELARRAIADHYGDDKPASYQECKNHLHTCINGDIETLISDYEGFENFHEPVRSDDD